MNFNIYIVLIWLISGRRKFFSVKVADNIN